MSFCAPPRRRRWPGESLVVQCPRCAESPAGREFSLLAAQTRRRYARHAMNSPITQLLLRWLVLALGVMLATKIVPGIQCDNGTTLIAVVLLLSFFNAILKPLLVLFTLPFILVTMGLGVVVINAVLFLLVGQLVHGFYVAGFWTALGGSLVVSLTNLLVSVVTRGGKAQSSPPKDGKSKGDDVIDI